MMLQCQVMLKNVVYVNVEIYNVEQRQTNVVYFNVFYRAPPVAASSLYTDKFKLQKLMGKLTHNMEV